MLINRKTCLIPLLDKLISKIVFKMIVSGVGSYVRQAKFCLGLCQGGVFCVFFFFFFFLGGGGVLPFLPLTYRLACLILADILKRTLN